MDPIKQGITAPPSRTCRPDSSRLDTRSTKPSSPPTTSPQYRLRRGLIPRRRRARRRRPGGLHLLERPRRRLLQAWRPNALPATPQLPRRRRPRAAASPQHARLRLRRRRRLLPPHRGGAAAVPGERRALRRWHGAPGHLQLHQPPAPRLEGQALRRGCRPPARHRLRAAPRTCSRTPASRSAARTRSPATSPPRIWNIASATTENSGVALIDGDVARGRRRRLHHRMRRAAGTPSPAISLAECQNPSQRIRTAIAAGQAAPRPRPPRVDRHLALRRLHLERRPDARRAPARRRLRCTRRASTLNYVACLGRNAARPHRQNRFFGHRPAADPVFGAGYGGSNPSAPAI